MRRYAGRHGSRPPWWPHNEPWPPAGSSYGWRRGRRRFLYRTAGVLIFALVFGAVGLARLLWLLSERTGIFIPPPLVFVALLALVFGVPALFFGGMRRVGLPLGDIVDAAERVGGGDFSARLIERGPPFLRSVARAFNTMTSRLETQERQRRDLMADVAHELRTPLAVMRGRLEGIIDGVYGRDDGMLLSLVDETKHLERLVEDLRTLAHADGGTLRLRRETTDVAVLIEDVLRSFDASAESSGVELRAASSGELPLVEIDPVRVREVLSNLIANAVRHSVAGGTVAVFAEATVDVIAVRVEDNGSGIAAEDLPRVFDRFAKSRDSTGSGLGLAIAKRLVELHGGEITAESQVGKGTTIAFTIPL
jgi:signal transduction histidine kinase